MGLRELQSPVAERSETCNLAPSQEPIRHTKGTFWQPRDLILFINSIIIKYSF